MHTVKLEIKDTAYEKVMYLLDHLKGDVNIIDVIETVSRDDADFPYFEDAQKRREAGEELYSIDQVIKDL